MIIEIPRLVLPSTTSKPEAFNQVRRYLNAMKLEVESADTKRPWGGFYLISNESHPTFLEIFFPNLKEELVKTNLPISAKILLAQPGNRNSDQFHHRRKEAWRVWSGPAEVHLYDPASGKFIIQILDKNSQIRIEALQRHRLGAMASSWAVVAETWIHTDPNNPSDEQDIKRLSDLYGREDK